MTFSAVNEREFAELLAAGWDCGLDPLAERGVRGTPGWFRGIDFVYGVRKVGWYVRGASVGGLARELGPFETASAAIAALDAMIEEEISA